MSDYPDTGHEARLRVAMQRASGAVSHTSRRRVTSIREACASSTGPMIRCSFDLVDYPPVTPDFAVLNPPVAFQRAQQLTTVLTSRCRCLDTSLRHSVNTCAVCARAPDRRPHAARHDNNQIPIAGSAPTSVHPRAPSPQRLGCLRNQARIARRLVRLVAADLSPLASLATWARGCRMSTEPNYDPRPSTAAESSLRPFLWT